MSRKFDVPLLSDEEDCDDILQHFEPGKITLEAKRDGSKTSSESATLEKSTEKQMECDVTETREPLASNKPTTRFESEFSSLRSSKYYDKTVETSSSSVNNDQPKVVSKTSSPNAVLVNPRQRGNPLLKHIRNVPWEFSEIEPDYVLGRTACALFLSLRYHNLFPNYIHERLKALGKSYELRVLLVQVDISEPTPPLKDLSVIAILADCTLMVSWSAEEAGNYIETYKMFENKSADLIRERQDDDNYSQLIDCLTTIRSINKTDAAVLLSTFKTLKGIVKASVDEISMCPGIGPLKAKRLYDALRKPLKNKPKTT